MDNLHVAILSSPGMGHLIPVLVLGNRLAAAHNVIVTVLQVGAAAESKRLNFPLHHSVEIVNLPPVDISHLINPSTHIVTHLSLTMRESAPLVHSALAAMNPRPAAIFVDHFGTDMLPVAADLNMARYVYVPSNAWFTALTVYIPILDKEIKGEYVDQEKPLNIPGCKPVDPDDVVDPMLDRSDQQYEEYLRLARQMVLFDGILINSWEELDPETLRAFAENEELRSVIGIPVHPIGPLTRPAEPDDSDTELMSWLDQQDNDSVIFVSFGSGGVLSQQQMTELAWGLEMSGQRFVWVVRPPTTGRVDEAFLSSTLTDISDDTPSYLPNGFMTRVKEVGFLVHGWAQQVQILNHRAVGGFLSHCGWNSTLESINGGVPMIAWPLYAEQKMNAAFLVEGGLALRPSKSKEVVGREEIGTMVRALMEKKEGQCLREKVKMVKRSGVEALKIAGSSHKSMCGVLGKIPSI